MHRQTSDPSFIDVLISHHAGRNNRLERIDRLIDWPQVARILARRWIPAYAGMTDRGARPVRRRRPPTGRRRRSCRA